VNLFRQFGAKKRRSERLQDAGYGEVIGGGVGVCRGGERHE